MSNISLNALEEAKRIILGGLKGYDVAVFLFGSRARGVATAFSDIDVALYPKEILPPGLLSSIREELEESGIPYLVEIVDLTQLSQSWLEEIKRDGVVWKE
jgi:predicted nucleotidyltransferase